MFFGIFITRGIGLLRRLLASARPLLPALYITLLAAIVVHECLFKTAVMGEPRAWDGTGHYGIARIYDQTIFPDTFGWTNAYFGGMPFPNFYPPLFFWCVSLLHRTHLLTFLAAFKLLLFLPVLLMPAVMWVFAWAVSERDRGIAFWASLLSLLPLIDPRFGGHLTWSSGLDYFSTLAIGMYTQPLGFVLLLLWYAVYIKAHRGVWRFALSSLLLALAVLTNYLNGVTAVLFIAATLATDALRRLRAGASVGEADGERLALVAHAAAPVVSAGLALFWLLPMVSTYQYLVTRPFTMVVFTDAMVGWYAAGAFGMLCWMRRPTRATYPYIAVCLVTAGVLGLASSISPRWYPLQANRFSPMLNFLLAVPVGYGVVTLLRLLWSLCARSAPRLTTRAIANRAYALWAGALLLFAGAYTASQIWEMKVLAQFQMPLAFYPAEAGSIPLADPAYSRSVRGDADIVRVLQDSSPSDFRREEILRLYEKQHKNDDRVVQAAAAEVGAVLEFARTHRDGRYLVEFPDLYGTGAAAYDSRALNSYLGAQGNQTLTVVYREASPNALFTYPLVNALSFNPDNFGFSSVLADDLDFNEQPLAKHLDRALLLGAKYLVIFTEKMKGRLAREAAVGARHDFGAWSVFELNGEPAPAVRRLPYRPALLVSDFTLKGRDGREYSYIRFAEEQFADGWFDVLLARAPTVRLDDLGSLKELRRFGAIILDKYECEQCELVYQELRDYAQERPLVIIASDTQLFSRIKASSEDFPLAKVIERRPDLTEKWLANSWPMRRYGESAIRQEWGEIRRFLDEHKVPTEEVAVGGEVSQKEIEISYPRAGGPAPQSPTPVLVSTTYHPNWQRTDGGEVYAATPMYILTFVDRPARLVFARRPLDYLALFLSALFWLGLLGGCAGHYFRRRRSHAVHLSSVAPLA